MDILMALIMIIAGFFFLVKGADLFVDSASGIAGKLGISPVVIGLTIVAFGTSMPELAVSVTAALEGANEIALGNVVGSNIFNLLVIAGGSACLYPLACDHILLKRDWPLSALAALVLGIFLFGDQRISRGEALILLAMFGAVLFMQLKGAKQTEEKAPETRPMGRLLLFLVIGIAAIVIGGQITVDGATSLARILGLSETLIGLTIVAVGHLAAGAGHFARCGAQRRERDRDGQCHRVEPIQYPVHPRRIGAARSDPGGDHGAL